MPRVTSESGSAAASRAGEDPAASLTNELLARLDGAASAPLVSFARSYARRASTKRTDPAALDTLAAVVAGLYAFIGVRQPGTPIVRVFNTDRERDGWRSRGTVVEANVEDMPFLIDSVTEELRRHGLVVREVVHPVIGAERDGDGVLTAVMPARGALHRESVMHFEVDRRVPESALEELHDDVVRVIGDVGRSVRDFHSMADRVSRMVEFAQVAVSRYERDDVAETVAFLEWLTRDNFVFLGYREYSITGQGEDAVISVVPGSGLGILGNEAASSFAATRRVGELSAPLRERVLNGDLLSVTKTNRESTVHRGVRMDYVGVKRVSPDGQVVGELRMLGLFTSKAYAEPARQIPVVRRKLEHIMEAEDLFPGSHDFKAAVAIFESIPKDELFAAEPEFLRATVMRLLAMEERRGVQLFVRPDYQGHSVSAIVALPRDHVSTELRMRLASIIEERYGGDSVEYHLTYGETEPARFHFVIHVPGEIPSVPLDELEAEILEAARSWDDRLSDALGEEHGEAEGHALARRYGALFPDYYKSGTEIYLARFDVEQFEKLGRDRPYVIAIQNETHTAEPLTRLKLFKTGGKAELGDLLPMLEDLGLRIVEEVPTRLQEQNGGGRYLHDFGVLGPDGGPLDLAAVGDLVAEAAGAVWDGRAESDSLNRMVPAGRLTWRQVAILRAYRQYRQVLGRRVHQAVPERRVRPQRRRGAAADGAVRAAARPGTRRAGGGRCGARGADRRRPGRHRQPGRRSHPALVPGHDPGHRPHQRVQGGRLAAVPQLQAALRRGARHPQAGAALGDLRLQPGDGGRPPARRLHRPRRHPLERPAGGLPHRDPRPDEGADGEERGDRAHRRQGRVRPQAAAGRPGRAARGGAAAVHHADAGHA